MAFDGRPLASALVVTGAPGDSIPGLNAMTSVQVRDDLRRPLSVATSALGLVAALLWVVAAGIVAMMAYLSGLDRYRDFAVFKALGATTRRLLLGVVLQGAVVGLLASSVAVVPGLRAGAALPRRHRPHGRRCRGPWSRWRWSSASWRPC